MNPEEQPQPESPEEEPEESFADLLAAYDGSSSEDLQVGDRVEGRVIAIGPDTIYLDTGTKIDAVAEKAEFLDPDGHLPLAVGERLALFVVGRSEGEIRLSRALSGVGGLALLQEAQRSGLPVEGRVSGTCKGGFTVELLQRRAFCPISQMDLQPVEDPERYVGQSHPFLITQLDPGGRNIVVSRRRLLQREAQAALERFLASARPGDLLTGRVTRLQPFGAFVELAPGIEGLIHVSELGWSRVEHPEAMLAVGDSVQVKLLALQPGAREGQTRISLSLKQVTGDPWDQETLPVRSGDRVNGRVTRCAPFGAFVELAPGIEGLIHLSEMSYLRRVNRAEDAVQPGQSVLVQVKEIDRARRRIALSLREAEGDPWEGAGERYAPGRQVQGVLEKREKFGLFIALEAGVTGLLPRSAIPPGDPALERLRVGERLAVVVSAIDIAARKLTLAPAPEGEAGWREFSTPGASRPLGSLGEKLQEALKRSESKR
jgi:small subunit ribosomal protein S1